MGMINGKINEVVTLTASSPGEWKFVKGPKKPIMRIANDLKSLKFTPGQNGLYVFTCGNQKFEVLIGSVTPPPDESPESPESPPVEEPTAGTLIWDSDRDIDWTAVQKKLDENNAGLKPEEQLEYVRYDDIYGDQSKVNSGYLRTNASGNPRLLLFPKTHEICLEHDGKFGRLYLGKCNYNSRFVTKFKCDKQTNKPSFKGRNRHQYRQYLVEVLGWTEKKADEVAIELVQGGMGLGIDPKGSVDNDLEIEHDSGEVSGPQKSFSPALEANQYHELEYSIFDKDGKIHVIDKINGKVVSEGDVKAPSQFFNKAQFLEWSEYWFRYNTPEQANQRMYMQHAKLYAL